MATAWQSSTRQPKFGKKEIFLPNFTLTLLRTPFLPPTFATFVVPLHLTKIDIRDYIYHAYGIKALTVRSFVQQQKVRQGKPSSLKPASRQWFRPRAIKRMTVEMERPFVWPDEPDDFEPWDKKTWDAAQESQEAEREKYTQKATLNPPEDRETIAEQARRLLTGKERWTAQWEDVGEPVEVEKDLPMS